MKKLRKHIHHLFVPHAGNNHRSKVLHHSSLLVVLFALLALIAASSFIRSNVPGVLGISYSISTIELLNSTNQARQQNGLEPLVLSSKLSEAASGKAEHMFTNNYWAHFAPDGTTPWQFIKGSGYEYVYAGENLAKGFTQSGEIVNAWMNSPSHRENLLSSRYNEIGFAVVEGSLLGEETILVVQMFGAAEGGIAESPSETVQLPQEAPNAQFATAPNSQPEVQPVKTQNIEELPSSKIQSTSLISPDTMSRTITLIVFSVILFALLIDFVIIGKSKIPRLVGNNLDHILLVSIFIILIVIQTKGGIL